MREIVKQGQLAEARIVIDRLSAQTTAVPPDPPGPPAAATTTGLNGNYLVDARALGNPLPFSGEVTGEGKPGGGSSFTFRVYAGTVDASCRETLDFAARRTDEDQPISKITIEPHERGRALSVVQRVPEGWGIEAWSQLCIEFEPKLPSRFQGMLHHLLDPARGPDAVENIHAWERKLTQHEEQSGDTIADTIKLATLNRKLLEGTRRSRTYLRATASQEQEPAPMDLSPVTGELYLITRCGKGNGKGKGKTGNGKNHDGKGKNKRVCFYYARPNHAKQERRVSATDRTNNDIKPDKAGRYMGKPVDMVIGKRADTEKGDMAALSDGDHYDEADGYVFALTDEVFVMGGCCALEGDDIDLFFDARAAECVCPPTRAPEVAVEGCGGVALDQADGDEVSHYGRKEASMMGQSSGEQLTVKFEAKGARKPIMAASSAVDAGYRARLNDGSGELRAATEKDEEQMKRARCCVAGQATEGPREGQSKGSTAAKLAPGYCFLAREGEPQKVAKKGVDDVAVEFALSYPEALLLELRRRRVEHHRAAIEKSTKHSGKANGSIEVVARRAGSLTRTCVAVIDDKYKTEATSLPVTPPWLVRHPVCIVAGFVLKSDGPSAWATMRGAECTWPLAGAGEAACFKLIRKDQSKLDRAGVFLGRRGESDEVVVGAARGIEFAWSFKRRDVSEHCVQGQFSPPIGAPWDPRAPATGAPVASARRRCITRALIEEHGESPDCAACPRLSSARAIARRARFEEIFRKQADQLIQPCPRRALRLALEGAKRELDAMEEFEAMAWKRRREKPPGERVISTELFHARKGPDCARSRIVARDSAGGVFAPEHSAEAPPTWALKLVISRLASRGESRQLASHDDSVAFFHAQLKALYGVRESSADLQELVRGACRGRGWDILATAPCLACRSEWDCLAGFHGGDFYAEGEPQQLGKVDAMITGSSKDKGMVLRRLLPWNPNGFILLLDPKHFENLSTLLDLSGAQPPSTPVSRATGKNARDALEELKRAGKAIYCRGTGICMHIGPDRCDIQFAAKQLASDAAHPTCLSMMRLRRLARYLAGTHDVGIEFFYQAPWNDIAAHSDGDWSGDVQTCKSTLETPALAISSRAGASPRSEFYALGVDAARGITVEQVMVGIAEEGAGLRAGAKLIIRADSDAARGMIHRARHFWHQQAPREKQLEIERVDGEKKLSDAGAKALDQEVLQACVVNLGVAGGAAAGFGAGEAAQVLAAPWLRATARAACGSDVGTCAAGASQTETCGLTIKVFVAITLIAAGFMAGVLYEKHHSWG
ncbi:unnamed protein product [Prorocentrum cordatum]|uniref:RNA-directed RNA polymerase n=1 Tax=Prorocentrum cordatum TaxID=2364126 RepID=A0ABN9PS93_9DINO|nr:unnamed protein product [Polarella glacialis]